MFFRMIFGLPGAAIITALLFLAMGLMIKQDAQPTAPIDAPDFSILAELEPSDSKPKPPTRVKTVAPPPVEIDFVPPSDKPGPTSIDKIPGPNIDGGGPIGNWYGTPPTIRIAPTYPENCRARGAQGVVMVEFDVTADGAVVNPRVIASENSCLDRAALNTISKWKFQPQTDSSGRPIPQRGLRQSFNFQLTAAD
jgi:protein TonB